MVRDRNLQPKPTRTSEAAHDPLTLVTLTPSYLYNSYINLYIMRLNLTALLTPLCLQSSGYTFPNPILQQSHDLTLESTIIKPDHNSPLHLDITQVTIFSQNPALQPLAYNPT